ncbi:MAG: hypothetical protein RMM30_02470 [Armatimonadota bacterium]|nr:hypothetical protein [Armatimonadota bacterium]MDW8155437.1 hypothetical protein [Armatimonadota bacterium]
MSRSREELRRGIRALIQDTRRRMEELESGVPATPGRPLLPRPEDLKAQTPPAEVEAPPEAEEVRRATVRYIRPEAEVQEPRWSELARYDPRKGVCQAYFVNRRCWEVPDAYCNHALHVCMLRACPVYHLHREELERRFAARFKYLW